LQGHRAQVVADGHGRDGEIAVVGHGHGRSHLVESALVETDRRLGGASLFEEPHLVLGRTELVHHGGRRLGGIHRFGIEATDEQSGHMGGEHRRLRLRAGSVFEQRHGLLHQRHALLRVSAPPGAVGHGLQRRSLPLRVPDSNEQVTRLGDPLLGAIDVVLGSLAGFEESRRPVPVLAGGIGGPQVVRHGPGGVEPARSLARLHQGAEGAAPQVRAGRRRQIQRFAEVIGKQFGGIHSPLAADRLDPRRRSLVHPRSIVPGDLPVRHIPDEGVDEPEFLLALHRRITDRSDQLPANQLPEDGRRVRARTQRRECARPEHLAHHRSRLEHFLLGGAEEIETGRDDGLDRVGEGQAGDVAPLLEQSTVGCEPNQLGDIEGVPAGSPENVLLDLGGEDRPVEERSEQGRGIGVGQRSQADRRRVPDAATPPGARGEQFRTGRGDDQDGDIHGPLGEVLEEVEHRVVRPVDVLDDHHQWMTPGHRLEEARPRREQFSLLDMLAPAHAPGEQ